MDLPVQQVVACDYKDLPKHTPIINALNVDYYLYVRLPDYIDETYSFYDLQEIEPAHLNLILDERSERIKRVRNVWIKIIFPVLGLRHGQHVYKMKFLTKENDTIQLYFSYIIQNDDVRRPYVYMNRRKRCCCKHDCHICE